MLLRILRFILNLPKPGNLNDRTNEEEEESTEHKLGSSLDEKLSLLQARMKGSSDFVLRELGESRDISQRLSISYLEGLVDQQLLSQLMDSLIQLMEGEYREEMRSESWWTEQIPFGNITKIKEEEQLFDSILNGEVAVLIEGFNEVFFVSMGGGKRRSVVEPTSQTVIRGPKEGFVEDVATNIALIRRIIRSTDLKFEGRTIGSYTKTKVVMAYIEGLAAEELVKEMAARLDSIDTDSILESGYIEEFIQDGVFTPFPTINNTERPDAVSAGLLEGQIAVLVDGSPFVLLAPVTFFKFFNSSEDYYQRYDISSFLRLIRFSSFVVALLLPAIFIATTTYQQEMLPTTLLISLAAQRESTPLPALLEALIMELTFEVIREAGVRMPRAIGPAISIVGALVLGQAAVQAGLVSAAMVIVVSFTAISNFVLPAFNMSNSIRLLRFGLMILAGTLGMFGILAGIIPILVHLVSIRTFGVPYMTPMAPFVKSDLKDFMVRIPWWGMKTRPKVVSHQNRVRQASKQKPHSQQHKAAKNKDPLE